MQSFSLVRGSILPLVTVALMCSVLEARADVRAEDETAIHKLLESGLKAYNNHDSKAWSMIFHPDADFTNVIGWTLHGRDQIENYFERLFAKDRHPKLP